MMNKNKFNPFGLPTPEEMQKFNNDYMRMQVRQYIAFRSSTQNRVILKENFILAVSLMTSDKFFEQIMSRNIPLNPNGIFMEIVSAVTERHIFYCFSLNDSERAKLQVSDDYRNKIANETANELIINKHLGKTSLNTTTALYPPISKIIVINNLLYEIIISSHKYKLASPKHNAINNVVIRIIEQVKSCSVLLDKGLVSDAITLWRGLYESELTLVVLTYWDEPVSAEYLEFTEFQLLERNLDAPDKSIEEINKNLEEKLKLRGVKRSTAFINYGWLMQTQEYDDKNCKLNLKDGLAVIADQYVKYTSYQLASNIAHSPFFSRHLNQGRLLSYIIEMVAFSLETIADAVLYYMDEQGFVVENATIELLNQSREELNEHLKIIVKNDSN